MPPDQLLTRYEVQVLGALAEDVLPLLVECS